MTCRCTLQLLALALIGCGDVSETVTDVNLPGPRSLRLSTASELEIDIYKNGACLTNVSGYGFTIKPKSGFAPYFLGDEFAKDVSTSTATIVPDGNQLAAGCPQAEFEDGFAPNSSHNKVWNGVFTATLVTPVNTCSFDFAENYINQDSNNGNFYDQMAGDQTIRFDLSSSGFCLGANVTTSQHPLPSTRLQASVSSSTTTWGLPGDTFHFIPSVQGGLGNYKYSWRFIIENPLEYTDWSEFSSSTPYSRTFADYGDVIAQVLARDGNDAMHGGGQYAISDWFSVAVEEPIPHNAMDMGNSLPGTVWGTVWYATSVTMKNTGTETWSGSSFTLDQMPSQIWSPSNTGLASSSVESGEMHSFNFNMVTYQSNQGYYDNYWKMKNGTMFGQDNGRSTYNKGIHPDSSLASTGQWLSRILAMMSPGELIAAGHWNQSDIVQVLRKENFPLDAARVQADGRFVLRYEASLDEDWDVDFSLRVKFDPRQFSVGSLIKGARSETHDLRVRMISPGELLVEGTRFTSNMGLVGRDTIFELPLELKRNAQTPSSLPLVELIAYE